LGASRSTSARPRATKWRKALIGGGWRGQPSLQRPARSWKLFLWRRPSRCRTPLIKFGTQRQRGKVAAVKRGQGVARFRVRTGSAAREAQQFAENALPFYRRAGYRAN
jgi:hypothetical protein